MYNLYEFIQLFSLIKILHAPCKWLVWLGYDNRKAYMGFTYKIVSLGDWNYYYLFYDIKCYIGTML